MTNKDVSTPPASTQMSSDGAHTPAPPGEAGKSIGWHKAYVEAHALICECRSVRCT